MGKLQLYMTMSREEFAHKVDVNATQDVKQWVCDLFDAVRQVEYNPKHKHIFYMLKYIDTGVFIVVIRTIPREHGYHLASWIYVPYSLKISNAEVHRLVEFITDIVSNDSVGNKEIEAIRQEFGNEYPDDLLAPQFAPNEGSNYCYRYYGGNTGDTLGELIGQYRYQISYLAYAGTLLVDHEISANISGNNLTSAPKDSMVTLLPPLDPVIDGYKPNIFGEKFDVPFFVPYQRTIEVIWHKPGVPDKRVPVCASLPEMRAPGLESASPSQAIEVKTQPTQIRTVAPEPVEEEPIAEAEPVEEQHAQRFPKTRTIHPWETDAQTISIPQTKTEPTTPTEEKKATPTRHNVYIFEVPTTVGGMAEFTINTDHVIEDSPIEGYEAAIVREGAGHVNRLYYKEDRTFMTMLKQKGLWAVGGLIVGLVIGILCMCGRGGSPAEKAPDPANSDTTQQTTATTTETQPVTTPATQTSAQETPKPAKQPTEQPAAETPTQTATTTVSAQAIAYIDGNKKWVKTEMEKFPELAGLYEDLNTINYDRIINHWGPKLSASNTFTNRIVVHTKLGQKKTPIRKPYCTDGTITVQGWLNNVDPSKQH